MSYEIQTRQEQRRGCGYRQPGGKYLVAGKELAPCERLPIPLDVCPACHAGFKPARGWTWVDFNALAKAKPCTMVHETCPFCPLCAINREEQRKTAGLLWIGEKFYATPQEFMAEAARLGLSRRISAIPHGFKVGETLVLLAHRKALPKLPDHNGAVIYEPAIFTGFIPTAIEYVVKATDSADKLERLFEAGITLVHVIPIPEQTELQKAIAEEYERTGVPVLGMTGEAAIVDGEDLDMDGIEE